MRALFLLAALAFPTLAAAQGADTHMIDVRQTDEGYACRAAALPELNLSHDWRGGGRSASWHLPARDANAAALEMLVAFTPDDAAPFGTESVIRGFLLETAGAPLPARPRAAHLRIDGIPDATILSVEPDLSDPTILTVSVIERQRTLLAQRLMNAAIVELDLTDATVTTLRRYSWDIRKLRRAPELLQLVNWSCN
ncbi:MAG: hypothetical protein V4574_14860 [Pseudomonadota bacterium]